MISKEDKFVSDYRYVNQIVQRVDGADKVTGRSVFGADLMRADMLYLKGVYTSCVHGRLLAVHSERAKALPDVVDVFTAEDIPGKNEFGIIVPDQPAVSKDMVYAWSDVIALVLAETPEAAREGASYVQADYEVLPLTADYRTADRGIDARPEWFPGNISSDYHVDKGCTETGKDRAVFTVKSCYETKRIEHAYIEPEAIMTEWDGDQLIVRGSMQLPFDVQKYVAEGLCLPEEKVSVRRSEVGGSFGGKIELTIAMALRAALAAYKTGRPVLYVLTREESMRESHKRHPYQIECQIGADENGHFTFMEGHALMDGGIYMNLTPAVSWKGCVLGCGPYLVENVHYDVRSMVTNQLTCGSMRGFGTPQSIYAMENTVNELAFRMGESPYLLRKKNLLHQGDLSPAGDDMSRHVVSLEEVLDIAADYLKFEEKYEEYTKKNQDPKARYRYGVGIACTMRGTSGAQIPDKSQAVVYVGEDDKLHISLGLVEMGQGLKTTMIQMAAEQMELPMEDVIYDGPDTAIELNPGTTTGSRGTFMGGNALKLAIEDLKNKLKTCSLKDHPKGVGVFALPLPDWNFESGNGTPFHAYTFSAQTAEVRVDTWTGKVQVLEVAACHDAGRIINPAMARGQVEGGIVMSLGMALSEEFICGADGIPETKDFTQYLIPTVQDMPKMHVHFVEHEETQGPFGAKSLAEPAVELGAASIAGAVNMAIGADDPIRSLPITPEKVFMQLKKRRS